MQIKGRLGGRGNGGRLTSFLCPKWRKMGMGLLLGLQIGVTFSEIRGYTFGVFGGRIEGEGKGWF